MTVIVLGVGGARLWLERFPLKTKINIPCGLRLRLDRKEIVLNASHRQINIVAVKNVFATC